MMIHRDRHDQRDPLTGAATPDAMRRYVEAALDLSDTQGPSVVLLAIGIDGLASLASRQGTGHADAVLLGVADRLRGGLRQYDMVGRLPEGFCICLPEIFTSQAQGAAERLQRMLQGEQLWGDAGPTSIRCSIGLAFGRGPGTSAEELLIRAQTALCTAQDAGGSRIVVSH